ncbi:MAG: glycosyltransferase family 1 protein [Spartobacteria bacterium]|nr:glycosyltransferase family 1 protein [Spartobacteria bacterium]
MNIALISREYPWRKPFGGVGVYTAAMARALVAVGNRVTVITQAPDGAARNEERAGVHLIGLPPPCSGVLGRCCSYSLIAAALWSRQAARIMRDARPAFDIIEAPSMNGEGLTLQCRGYAPVIRIHGGAALNLSVKGAYRWHHALLYKREQATLRRAAALSAVSRLAAREIGAFYRVDTLSAEIIPNPVDTEQFCPGETPPVRDILFVGHLNEIKGFDRLPEIMNSIWREKPEATLTVVGAEQILRVGGERSRDFFFARIAPSQREHVEFCGVVPTEAMPALYQRHVLLLAPSRRDTFSLAAAEASACGVPVIGTRGTGMEDIIEDQQSGFLVSQEDVCADSARMALEVLNSEEKRQCMSKNARRRALDVYSFDHLGKVMQQFYEQCAVSGMKTGRI